MISEHEETSRNHNEEKKQDSGGSACTQDHEYSHTEDPVNPGNFRGRRVYDRELLLKLRHTEMSRAKPAGIPELLDVVGYYGWHCDNCTTMNPVLQQSCQGEGCSSTRPPNHELPCNDSKSDLEKADLFSGLQNEEVAYVQGKAPVSLLQEICTKRGLGLPEYDFIAKEGTAVHMPTFVCKASAVGRGKTKQKAKHNAALLVLEKMKVVKHGEDGSRNLVEDFSKMSFKEDKRGSGDWASANPVGELQEMTQKQALPYPRYDFTDMGGPPHARQFVCDVQWQHYSEQGIGSSKKVAKHNAAQNLLKRIQQPGSEVPSAGYQQQQDEEEGNMSEISMSVGSDDSWSISFSNRENDLPPTSPSKPNLKLKITENSQGMPEAYNSRYLTDFDHEDCLGKGGFGVVFRAKNKIDGRLYAIKRISLTNSERAKEKVMREVRALASLEHPHIVRYYNAWFENPPPGWQEEMDQKLEGSFGSSPTYTYPDSGLTSSTPSSWFSGVANRPKQYFYIQMQLCQGSLRDQLAENKLNRDSENLLAVFKQMVSAVDYMHESGLIHRDLTPANVFFSMDGVVKVGDFGLVTPLEEWQLCENSNQNQASCQHTAYVGTILYMSPEQEKKQPYDNKVDIFALGMILFELFFPFSTQSERVRTLPDVRRLKLPESFSQDHPDVCTLTKKLLSSDPSERPSAKEILCHELIQHIESRTSASP